MTSETITRFGLIRHGETEWNRSRRIQGQLDSPLTDAGRLQATGWGKRLTCCRWDRILVSDLGRAMETGRLINRTLQLPVDSDAGLREQDWGAWIGMTLADVKRQHPNELSHQVRAGWRFCPPEGESRREVLYRCTTALQTAARRWPGQTVLVVAHEGVIKCLVYHLSGRRFLPEEPPLVKRRHLHWIESDGKALRAGEINALPLTHSTVTVHAARRKNGEPRDSQR